MSSWILKILRTPSLIELLLFKKYLFGTVNIILLSIFIYFIILHRQPMYIIIYLIFVPTTLFFKPRLIVRSKNILFLSFFTYFTVPLFLNFLIGILLKISVPVSLISIFITVFLLFGILFLKFKDNDRVTFLNHTKIALDLIRFIFVAIVTLSAVYSKIINDFGFFTQLFTDFSNNKVDQLRDYFQLTIQVLSIPFIFSSTLLKIIVDWILLKRIDGDKSRFTNPLPERPSKPTQNL